MRGAGALSDHLIKYYTCVLRPVLEFEAPNLQSMLTMEMSGFLELLQAKVLRIVFGSRTSYRTVLQFCNMERLDRQRKDLFRKFALKCSKNPRVSVRWFPLNEVNAIANKGRNIYQEVTTITD